RVLLDDGVGVEQQHVLGRVVRLQRRADHGIIAAGEPPVGVDRREVDPRIPAVLVDGLAEALLGVAAGAVLAERDARAGDLADLVLERAQTVDRQVGDAIRDDDDEEFHGALIGDIRPTTALPERLPAAGLPRVQGPRRCRTEPARPGPRRWAPEACWSGRR